MKYSKGACEPRVTRAQMCKLTQASRLPLNLSQMCGDTRQATGRGTEEGRLRYVVQQQRSAFSSLQPYEVMRGAKGDAKGHW